MFELCHFAWQLLMPAGEDSNRRKNKASIQSKTNADDDDRPSGHRRTSEHDTAHASQHVRRERHQHLAADRSAPSGTDKALRTASRKQSKANGDEDNGDHSDKIELQTAHVKETEKKTNSFYYSFFEDDDDDDDDEDDEEYDDSDDDSFFARIKRMFTGNEYTE